MNRKPPFWWTAQNDERPENERETETSILEGAFIHHAIALTITDVARAISRSDSKGPGVRLLTQDPAYVGETESILHDTGLFEVVGTYGAGGFAELDDESVVFSPFVNAPVRQITADIARPVAVICIDGIETLNRKGLDVEIGGVGILHFKRMHKRVVDEEKILQLGMTAPE
ncbi:uncharacterized protein JN550_008012 [Neoarthrinium moseri]|uniref:uncharacterized protein n=1 Tax=Neoarthrinium moseri TaxID=1658444 RepID=UPI001FDD83A2|nr:uncharacterized protein JN550_008012 [Neoarthrinium moseri]KAI1866034.1 hypothetical protein JN550_008012 [Neoarthrinium moseri]